MKRKQRLENFVFYDTESVTAHLEDMAQKGWALAAVTNPLWTYEEIQPEKRTYRTAFYPANQVYAPNAPEKQEEYIAYCEQAGWHYATNWDNMLIFYTTAENPVPLETDEALRLEATHKAMKRSWLSIHVVLGILFLLNIISYVSALAKQPLTVIADGNALFRNALFAVVLVYACIAVGSYLQWRRKSLSAVESGSFCLPVSRNVQRFQKIFFPLEIFAGLWFCLDRFLPDDMLTPKIFLAFIALVFLLWLHPVFCGGNGAHVLLHGFSQSESGRSQSQSHQPMGRPLCGDTAQRGTGNYLIAKGCNPPDHGRPDGSAERRCLYHCPEGAILSLSNKTGMFAGNP